MKPLLRDARVWRLLVANTFGSIGSGITIFAVPWTLVNRPNGSEAFRWCTIGTTLVLFLIMPYYGALVDRSSRRSMLLLSELFGLAATLSMAAVALGLGRIETWQLVTVYFCGMLYYSLHYPAKFAFIQQLFDRSQYQSLIGLLEVQGQTAMMLAGGLGGFMVARGVSLPTILLIDASTYAFSFTVLSGLPKDVVPALTATASPAARRTWKMVADGWRWLQERPRLNLFLLCSLMPFIAVMAANYLFPVYVSQVLKADARVFGWGEITFAAGAIVAGAFLPRLIAHHSAYRTIGATFLVFMAGLLLVTSVPTTLFYLLAGALLGFGNAGCRVARNALMLNLVPNDVMGRVNVFYNVFDRLMRTLLVAALGIIDVAGAKAGFLLLLAVTALAYLGVVRSRESIRTDLPAAVVPTT